MMQQTEEAPSSNTEDDAREKERIWCLQRVGRESDWLRLFEDSEVSVGRGLNVTHQILSSSCPLMISRVHCVFKINDNKQWTVTDNKSLNGVWVNGQRIPAGCPFLLQQGDSLHLGVPLDGNPVEFDYLLVQKSFGDVKHFLSRSLLKDTSTSSVTHKTKNHKRKLDGDDCEPSLAQTSKSKLYKSDKLQAQPCPEDALELGRSSDRPGSSSADEKQSLEVLRRYDTMLMSLKEHVGSFRKQSAEERTPKLSPESLRSQKQTPLKSRGEEKPTPDRQREVRELEKQVETLRSQLQEQQQEALQQKETPQESTRDEERRLEMESAQQTEEALKKQLEEALKEQRKAMEELKHAREGFEEVLQAKDKELEVTKEEKEKAKAQKEEVVSQMAEVLESELQCSICSELFIEAVTLNCAHSFCRFCIHEWRSRKDKCPMCWQSIVSETRSLVLDSCIDRMLDQLSSETRERRQALLRQRRGQKASAPPAVVVINDDSDSESSSSSEVDSYLLSHSSLLQESLWSDESLLPEEDSPWTEEDSGGGELL